MMMTLAELGVALAIGVASYALLLAAVICRCRRSSARPTPHRRKPELHPARPRRHPGGIGAHGHAFVA